MGECACRFQIVLIEYDMYWPAIFHCAQSNKGFAAAAPADSTAVGMKSMKLVIPLRFISWKKLILWYEQEVHFTKNV